MAIRQGKCFKVAEQSLENDGCGAILASFSVSVMGSEEAALQAANERAARLAGENPGTRYYVFAAVNGCYVDRTGGLVRRTY